MRTTVPMPVPAQQLLSSGALAPLPVKAVPVAPQRFIVAFRPAICWLEGSRPLRTLASLASAVHLQGEIMKARAQRRKHSRRVLDTLSCEEIQKLEDAAESERDKLIIRILADTGIRVSELLGLTRTP